MKNNNRYQGRVSKVTLSDWPNHCKHIEIVENEYWRKGEFIEEDLVDKLIIEVGDNVSDFYTDTDETTINASENDFDDIRPLASLISFTKTSKITLLKALD